MSMVQSISDERQLLDRLDRDRPPVPRAHRTGELAAELGAHGGYLHGVDADGTLKIGGSALARQLTHALAAELRHWRPTLVELRRRQETEPDPDPTGALARLLRECQPYKDEF
jgi:hypothetical protein